MPVVLGPLLLGCHVWTMWLWLWLRIIVTVDEHCGYEWKCWSPLKPLPAVTGYTDKHDFHHSHTRLGSYGTGPLDVWDWICGTDKVCFVLLDVTVNSFIISIFTGVLEVS